MPNIVNASDEKECVAVKLPVHLVERIDAKRAAMAKASPGVAITRSDAVRALLLAALDAERGS